MSMPTGQLTSYDEVPYQSHPFPQTHPDRLGVIATLLGLRPPRLESCRVLELGCASGGNLVPMALTLPEARFVGVDLSRVQIAEGLETVQALGLSNIELRQHSIMDITSEMGKFDYILCHGVFSWVPDQVQDKIFDICARQLTPHGIAYISYNTYPGWHMRGMIRDMLGYHAANFVGPAMKVKQARNLLDFLARAVSREQSPYSLLLRNELEAFRRSPDSYLYHEHLEEYNTPLYFHQFAERAAAKGLRYLGEADLRVMVPGNYPPEIQSVLQMLAQDQIHLEQYMDFLRNRMFRQTLLCHKELSPTYNLRPELMKHFYVASPAQPISSNSAVSPGTAREEAVDKYETPDGLVLNAGDPLVKAAMSTLCARWPMPMPFTELAKECLHKLTETPPLPTVISMAGTPGGTSEPCGAPANDQSDMHTLESVTQALGQALLNFYASASTTLLELSLHPARFSTIPGPRPKASPLARRQAESSNQVTNLRHETVTLSDFERHVLRHLDGTHGTDELLPILEKLTEADELQVEKEGLPVRAGAELHQILNDSLPQALGLLSRKALLLS